MRRLALLCVAIALVGCPLSKRKKAAPDADAGAAPSAAATATKTGPTEACSWGAAVGLPRATHWNDSLGDGNYHCSSAARDLGKASLQYWVHGDITSAKRVSLVLDVLDPKAGEAAIGEMADAFAGIVREGLHQELSSSARTLVRHPADRNTEVAGRLLQIKKTNHETGDGFEVRLELSLTP